MQHIFLYIFKGLIIINEKIITKRPHCLNLDNRKTLKITGVTDVNNFNEQTLIASTDIGELTIKGENLNINKLNLETGILEVNGTITLLSYSDKKNISSKNFLKSIFNIHN